MGNNCCYVPVQYEIEDQTPVQIKILKSQEDYARSLVYYRRSPANLILVGYENSNHIALKAAFCWLNIKYSSLFPVQNIHEWRQILWSLRSGITLRIQAQKPHGLGKLYKSDGSLFIGYFKDGILNGSAFYVNKNGVICQGDVTNGILNCENGLLQTSDFKYVGGFKENKFDGKCTLLTPNSKFEGTFENGKKKIGKLSWSEGKYIYLYEGGFDQNEKFTGFGKLIEPYGEYEGQFSSGQKNGKGKYKYNSSIVYQGEYFKGMKQGRGKLINKDGSISYEGEFRNGVPHGKGSSFKNGALVKQGTFVEGIFQELL